MSSPLPPDPYEALGVSKDADVATVRTAHRKLALKHHPDRIRDEADREKGKNEFQKIQQAYEILTDPTRRARYDDRVKLAELRRERMMRQASQPTSSMPTGNGSRRDRNSEDIHYEFVGRVPHPQASYFDRDHDRDHYEDHVPRTAARKSDSYEKKSTPPKTEKREKLSQKFYGPMEDVSYRVSSQMKARAAEAKTRARESQRQKAEVRDKEKRRERTEKQSSRYAAHVDDETDSEIETILPNHFSKPKTEARYRSSEPEPEPIRAPIPRPSRRPPTFEDEDSQEEYEKWERHHKQSRDYIAESQKRPGMTRSGSDAHVYWGGDGRPGRKSGSDNEKRASGTTRTRRSAADEARPRPSMPVHSSAPTNLRSHVDREPPRSKTSSYPVDRDSRREMPSLARSHTMPVRPKKEGNAPARGSNLKHEAQPDSGYYSSSSPHTPEMRGDSPPRDTREAPREQSRRAQTSVKYTIVDPAESDNESTVRGPRINRTRILNHDEDRRRIHQSPERGGGRDKDRDSDRERARDRGPRPRLHKLDTDGGRTRSGRTPPSVSRPEFGRYEPQSPRESQSVNRKKLFGEYEETAPPSSYHQPPPSNVRTQSYGRPVYAEYRTSSPDEHGPDARFRQSPNFPTTSRRSSAANAY